MPGKKPKLDPNLNPLAARKQLLLMESEINRVELIAAMRAWHAEIQRSKLELEKIATIASTTSKIAGIFPAVARLFRRPKHGGVMSWLSFFIDGLSASGSLWSLIRSTLGVPRSKMSQEKS